VVEDDVVRRVDGLADLLQHHGPFAHQLLRVELRVLQDVGDQVEGERGILGQNLGIESRGLAPGIGVEVAADRLDLLGDVARATPRRALEGHVLEQMRHAVDLGRLVARADPDPGAQGDRLDRLEPVGRHGHAAVEPRHLDRHAAPSRTEALRIAAWTAVRSLGRVS
jgi:hypothetical protein